MVIISDTEVEYTCTAVRRVICGRVWTHWAVMMGLTVECTWSISVLLASALETCTSAPTPLDQVLGYSCMLPVDCMCTARDGSARHRVCYNRYLHGEKLTTKRGM